MGTSGYAHLKQQDSPVFPSFFPEGKFQKIRNLPGKHGLHFQVSVLKQALAEGEQVDVQDEKGLTALMWAARAGRLSTAKYLVAQGASLTSTDVATGFSPLHFAAYYCRCVFTVQPKKTRCVQAFKI